MTAEGVQKSPTRSADLNDTVAVKQLSCALGNQTKI